MPGVCVPWQVAAIKVGSEVRPNRQGRTWRRRQSGGQRKETALNMHAPLSHRRRREGLEKSSGVARWETAEAGSQFPAGHEKFPAQIASGSRSRCSRFRRIRPPFPLARFRSVEFRPVLLPLAPGHMGAVCVIFIQITVYIISNNVFYYAKLINKSIPSCSATASRSSPGIA